STFARLLQNIAVNGLGDRVTPIQCGVSHVAGSLRFTAGLDPMNRVLAGDEGGEGIEVPVRTVDEIVGTSVPAVLKVDVEGYEAAVLRGARGTLADPGLLAVVMEVNGLGKRYGVEDEELVAVLGTDGFAPYAYDPFRRELTDRNKADENVIFVRDRAAVGSRVRGARRFKLVNGEI